MRMRYGRGKISFADVRGSLTHTQNVYIIYTYKYDHAMQVGKSPNLVSRDLMGYRRKFRSQTSDDMDRCKSRGGKSQRGEAKKWEDQRRERVRRKKMQVRQKIGKSRFTVFFQWIVLHYNYNCSCTTPHYIQQLWVRWPLQPLQPPQETQHQPHFSPSVHSLCHPWITTTNLSCRFPILKLPPPPCAVLLVQKE